ncbi:MAG: hypothetical protein HKM95_09700 [Inquilinus sp.]|nr:hypothetical protein [Inquilinus sp.]
MPVWPAALPQDVLIAGYSEEVPETTIRTQMDAGPAKVRRRFSAGVRKFAVTVALTRAQVQILDDFYLTDLQGGALRFDWTHPRTLAAVQFRFLTAPRYASQSQIDWLAQLQLEVLP